MYIYSFAIDDLVHKPLQMKAGVAIDK